MRARILEAAADVLARLPLSKVSMDDVARAAGIARQTIYKHFASRDALVVALLVEETERTHRPALARLHAERVAAAQLTAMVLEQVRLANEWMLLSRTFDPASAPRIAELVLSSEELGACVRAIWVPILRDYADAGLLRGGLDLDEAVRWLTYQYVWLLSHPQALTGDAEGLRHYLHTYLTGGLLRAPD